jgi:hypothetical protein
MLSLPKHLARVCNLLRLDYYPLRDASQAQHDVLILRNKKLLLGTSRQHLALIVLRRNFQVYGAAVLLIPII